MQAARSIPQRLAPLRQQLVQSRGIQMGAREVELLSEDPALKEFMGTKKAAKRVQMAAEVVIFGLLVGVGFEFGYKILKPFRQGKY